MEEAPDYDYSSLKKVLSDTSAKVLLPGDGQEYEKSIERWSEHCIKRAVSLLHFTCLLWQFEWTDTRREVASSYHFSIEHLGLKLSFTAFELIQH